MTLSVHTVLGYLHSILSRPRGEQDDDRELLRRFVEARDADAFAVLMRRHVPMVLGLARRVVGDPHATILTAVGIDPKKVNQTPIGRTVRFAEGAAVAALLREKS